MSLPRKLHGSAVVALALRGDAKLPFAPREKVEAARDRRVRRLAAHAAATVPYYRDRFDPREIRTARDLDVLPVLDKDLPRSSPEQFLSGAVRKPLSFLTSGSTGAAMRVYHDRDSVLRNIAWGERERGAVIAGTGGSFRPKEVYVGNETSVMRDVQAFYAEATLMPARPRRRFVSVREPLERRGSDPRRRAARPPDGLRRLAAPVLQDRRRARLELPPPGDGDVHGGGACRRAGVS